MVRIPLNSTGGRLLDVFCREMDDFVGRMNDVETESAEQMAFSPRADVVETTSNFLVSLDLPGMNAVDFTIELHEGRLSISGERAQPVHEEGQAFQRLERYHGKFHRSFHLGQEVDADNVEATYTDGVLSITVAKTPKAQPTKIQVK